MSRTQQLQENPNRMSEEKDEETLNQIENPWPKWYTFSHSK